MNKGLLPEQKVDTPAVLGRLLKTPAMQSLLALGRMDFVDRAYWGDGTNVMQIVDMYSREDFDSQTGLLKSDGEFNSAMTGGRNKGFIYDINILVQEIQSWDEVRELFFAGLLHSRSVKYIYAGMCEMEKISHNRLTMDDGIMFGYKGREMETFIAMGSPMISFSPFMDRSLDDILGKDVSYLELDSFLEEQGISGDQAEILRQKIVKGDNKGVTFTGPRNLETYTSGYTFMYRDLMVSNSNAGLPSVYDYKKMLEGLGELGFMDMKQQFRFLTQVLGFQEGNYIIQGPQDSIFLFQIQERLGFAIYDEKLRQEIPEYTLFVKNLSFFTNRPGIQNEEDQKKESTS